MNKRYYKSVSRTFWCTKVYYEVDERQLFYYFPGELRREEILSLPFFSALSKRIYCSHEYVKVKCTMNLENFMYQSDIEELT